MILGTILGHVGSFLDHVWLLKQQDTLAHVLRRLETPLFDTLPLALKLPYSHALPVLMSSQVYVGVRFSFFFEASFLTSF